MNGSGSGSEVEPLPRSLAPRTRLFTLGHSSPNPHAGRSSSLAHMHGWHSTNDDVAGHRAVGIDERRLRTLGVVDCSRTAQCHSHHGAGADTASLAAGVAWRSQATGLSVANGMPVAIRPFNGNGVVV